MKKLLGTVAIAAVTLLGVLGAASATSAAKGRPFELIGRSAAEAEVPAPGGFLGTRFVGSDTLLHDGEEVGRSGRSCEAVGTARVGAGLFQCTITFDLEGGQLTSQALVELAEGEPASFTAAITGGTGDHRKARGTVDARQVTPEELHFTFSLR